MSNKCDKLHDSVIKEATRNAKNEIYSEILKVIGCVFAICAILFIIYQLYIYSNENYLKVDMFLSNNFSMICTCIFTKLAEIVIALTVAVGILIGAICLTFRFARPCGYDL